MSIVLLAAISLALLAVVALLGFVGCALYAGAIPTVSDYWEQWDDWWMNKFVEVDNVCEAFLRERNGWSLVKYRWDNPDRLLSGPVGNGIWGNIHILFIPEESKFRFSYAVWRDEDRGVDQGHRVSLRFWSTSDDDGTGDYYLSTDNASETNVRQTLEQAWGKLVTLSRQREFHEDWIRLPL
jgi:hypothetical protein